MKWSFLFLPVLFLFLVGCESNQMIVSSIDEKEANEIVVYLASKGVPAQKVQMEASDTGTGNAAALYSIAVAGDRSVDAMAILNKVGLPRRMGTNLLTLFAKSGLMSSDREETIRYQAGLAEELRNTIRKIDGVIDADVQISFPSSESTAIPGTPVPKTTAAVYIKHQGVIDDPNNHMEVKIKRLMAGSVNGLSYDQVVVISDRSRFTDITLSPEGEPIGNQLLEQTYVSIWGLVLTKSSLTKFRVIFFSFLFVIIALCAAIGFAVFKFYPQLLKLRHKSVSTSSDTPEE